MLTTLSTLKTRLAIDQADPTHDALLTSAIKSVSARFDKETNRTLARTENFTQEFDHHDTEILTPKSWPPAIRSKPSRNSKPKPPSRVAGCLPCRRVSRVRRGAPVGVAWTPDSCL